MDRSDKRDVEQDREKFQLETAGIESEIKDFINFFTRNLLVLALFGIVGLAFSLWLVFSNPSYGSGSLLHNYEVRVKYRQNVQLPADSVQYHNYNVMKFDADSIRTIKPQVLLEFTKILPEDDKILIDATFVENSTPVIVRVSSALPIDEITLKENTKQVFEKSFEYLKKNHVYQEEKAKETVLSMQDNLFGLYQRQHQLLQNLMMGLPSVNFDGAIRGSFDLRHFASLLNMSKLTPSEKRRIQSEYYDLEFQVLKVANDYKIYHTSTSYLNIIERSYSRYEIEQIDVQNLSGKQFTRSIIICLSSLFGGIVLGVFYCLLRERLSAVHFWIKQFKK